MAESDSDLPVDFVTLGMFIIDDIHPAPTAASQTPHLNIPGGAGTYAALGARLLSPPPTSKNLTWLIDAGPDFPASLRHSLATWQTHAVFRPRRDPTTRGWNGYTNAHHREFKYLTPKNRLTADDLTPAMLGAKSIHLICSATRLITEVTGILSRRKGLSRREEDVVGRPWVIWEPVPDLATPEELAKTCEALAYVDVVSPNHEELGALFGVAAQVSDGEGDVNKDVVEELAGRLLERGVGSEGRGAVVVRAGREGCYILSTRLSCWLPAYHTNPAKVIDPTGGGNGFLGGLAVGLVRTQGDVVEAARWGSVAASFCIEQVGVPELDVENGQGDRWNGVSVVERLDEFRRRTV